MIDLTEKFEEIQAHYQDIEQRMAEPATLKDNKLYTELSRKHRELSESLRAYKAREKFECFEA